MQMRTLKLGVRNLMLHKLRSLLTMLGTILGVSSVIAMLAIGEGSKREAIEQIRQLGATNIIIRTVKPERIVVEPESDDPFEALTASDRIIEYGLKYQEDYLRLKATLESTLERAVPISMVRKRVQNHRRHMANARILGTTPELFLVKNLSMRRGRFLAWPDLRNTANVAVLGAGAAEKLFSFEDPIGKPLHLGTTAFRIVGVLDTQASGAAKPGAVEQDDFNDDIYIPLTAARGRIGELEKTGSKQFERIELGEITLTVKDENLVSQTAAMARKLLRKTHPKGDDFQIVVPLELLKQAEREKQIWNLVLGSIAGISLLVGGIGIMNIMLATVTERTREIGIRRALGATRGDITAQFLVESTVLSTTGGIIGVLVGVGVPIVITFTSDITTVLSLWSVLMAFGISVGIGIVFGVYPARRAAMMDPIEALRHE